MIEELAPGVVVVGTAHVSPTSVAAVEATIRERRPAKVLVELDPRRLQALQDPDAWRKTDVVQVIKEGKQHLFLLQLYLASMQAKMGRETGVPPGTELLRAVEVAKEVGAEVVLIDRDVGVTLKRGFGALTFWRRMRLFWNLWMEFLTPSNAQQRPLDAKAQVEEMLKTDAITAMTEEFARFAPDIKNALIDERDQYMASHIAEQAAAVRLRAGSPTAPAAATAGWASGAAPKVPIDPAGTIHPDVAAAAVRSPPGITGKPPSPATQTRMSPPVTAAQPRQGGVVAVVGAGHLPGIKARLPTARAQDRVPLDALPAPRLTVGKVLAWLLPLALVGVFVYLAWRGYQDGNFSDLLASLGWFALITSTCAALGAAIALGHPWSIAAAFVAAPIATLHPLIASGWFAGLVEAKVRTPTVADFEAIKTLQTLKDFWRNGVVRILLVTAITNLGAMVGFWIATGRVLQILGGGA